mmetsp:Transcript_5596/g.15173  ORF Transcript_5596/g.15173 Transcript_5596/m.15173 type:complete len:233 (-) Transcript_5596:502-1200(-)
MLHQTRCRRCHQRGRPAHPAGEVGMRWRRGFRSRCHHAGAGGRCQPAPRRHRLHQQRGGVQILRKVDPERSQHHQPQSQGQRRTLRTLPARAQGRKPAAGPLAVREQRRWCPSHPYNAARSAGHRRPGPSHPRMRQRYHGARAQHLLRGRVIHRGRASGRRAQLRGIRHPRGFERIRQRPQGGHPGETAWTCSQRGGCGDRIVGSGGDHEQGLRLRHRRSQRGHPRGSQVDG